MMIMIMIMIHHHHRHRHRHRRRRRRRRHHHHHHYTGDIAVFASFYSWRTRHGCIQRLSSIKPLPIGRSAALLRPISSSAPDDDDVSSISRPPNSTCRHPWQPVTPRRLYTPPSLHSFGRSLQIHSTYGRRLKWDRTRLREDLMNILCSTSFLSA